MTSTPLAALAGKIAAGENSPEKAAADALAAIDAAADLNAFIEVTEARAATDISRAESLIDGNNDATLGGVPLAIKDIICTLESRTTCGSRLLSEFTSPYESTVTDLLCRAGAVVVGKTNLDEFAMGTTGENSAFGPTKNPWDRQRVPGGSSSGSAAAVAARLVSAAIGTDTGGSVRMPAAYCGICGIKPTYGMVSRRGLVAYGSSLDQAGVFATAAADLRRVLSVIARHDPEDSTSRPDANLPEKPERKDLKAIRIGVAAQLFDQSVSSEVAQLVRSAIEKMRQLGATIVDISLASIEHAIPAYYIIACAEAASNLSRFDGIRYGKRAEGESVDQLIMRSRSQGFGTEVKRRIMLGSFVLCHGYIDAYYRKAQQIRRQLIDEFAAAFAECDMIAAPAAPTTAPRLGEFSDDPVRMYGQDICTVPANLAGLPALAIPCGFADRLPVGLQLIGPQMADALLLDCAEAYQEATDFHASCPPEQQ